MRSPGGDLVLGGLQKIHPPFPYRIVRNANRKKIGLIGRGVQIDPIAPSIDYRNISHVHKHQSADLSGSHISRPDQFHDCRFGDAEMVRSKGERENAALCDGGRFALTKSIKRHGPPPFDPSRPMIRAIREPKNLDTGSGGLVWRIEDRPIGGAREG